MDIILLILTGVAGGVLAGMGMGGGTLLIPLLTWVCGLEQHAAQAINLVAFVPTAIITLIIHWKNGLLDFKKLLWLMVPAVIISVFASLFAGKVENGLLKMLFGGFLILLGIYQFVCAILTMVAAAKKKNKKPLPEGVEPEGTGKSLGELTAPEYPVTAPAAANPFAAEIEERENG